MSALGWVFKLRLPRFYGADARRGLEAVSTAYEGVSVRQRSGLRCPKCKEGRLVKPGDQPEIRVCSSGCGFSIALSELRELMPKAVFPELAGQQQQLSERLFYGGMAFLVLCSLWSAWTVNMLTLVGGVVASIPIFAMSLKARYRAWQIENQRLFENKPPFGNFIKEMIRKSSRDTAPSSGKELKGKIVVSDTEE